MGHINLNLDLNNPLAYLGGELMKYLAVVLCLMCVNVYAEECFDNKKGEWRDGKEKCGTSCYSCKENDYREKLKELYEKEFGECLLSKEITDGCDHYDPRPECKGVK